MIVCLALSGVPIEVATVLNNAIVKDLGELLMMEKLLLWIYILQLSFLQECLNS